MADGLPDSLEPKKMKLVRFGEIGLERPGLIDPEGALRSLEGIVCIGGNVLNAAMLAEFRAQDHTSLPKVTGTPRLGPPVGLGQKPPIYLRPGAVMELGIAGIGRQRQQVVEQNGFIRN